MLLCRLARHDLEESVYHTTGRRPQSARAQQDHRDADALAHLCALYYELLVWSLDPPLLLLLVRRGTGDPRPRLPK